MDRIRRLPRAHHFRRAERSRDRQRGRRETAIAADEGTDFWTTTPRAWWEFATPEGSPYVWRRGPFLRSYLTQANGWISRPPGGWCRPLRWSRRAGRP